MRAMVHQKAGDSKTIIAGDHYTCPNQVRRNLYCAERLNAVRQGCQVCETKPAQLLFKTSPIMFCFFVCFFPVVFPFVRGFQGDHFNLWTSKSTCSNSVKVAQFCSKTADNPAVQCDSIIVEGYLRQDFGPMRVYLVGGATWHKQFRTIKCSGSLLVVRTQTRRHHLILFFQLDWDKRIQCIPET